MFERISRKGVPMSKPKKIGQSPVTDADIKQISQNLFEDISQLIEQTRRKVSQSVNSGLVLLYWNIGRRIKQDLMSDERAEYGKQIVGTVSLQLVDRYGKGFTKDNLFRMIKLYDRFQDVKIVGTLSQQLCWSHFVKIIPIDNELKRSFYAEMCRIEGWNVRILNKKIGGMLFERTALSKKPEKLVEKGIKELRETDKLTPDLVFRDPYFLDFLGLKDSYQEKDIEAGILREMESFILELGVGFTFVERQKRITIDGDDFYLDLLFFHRDLRRLIAVELKLDKFKPGHKGQMELYLRWLEKYEKKPGEESPLGLILCAGKSAEQVELLELDKSGIRVSSYMTELPEKKLLETKLHESLILARERFALEK